MAGKPRVKKAPAEVPQEVHPKAGLDIKVKLNKLESGRLTVSVTLLQDGKEIASDYDFTQV